MSCRPTVPQATRTFVVRRLDDADHELTLLKKARGYECMDKVRLLEYSTLPDLAFILRLPNNNSRNILL